MIYPIQNINYNQLTKGSFNVPTYSSSKLIVSGFIRTYWDNYLPKDLIKLIIMYHFNAGDVFDEKSSHNLLRFNNTNTRLVRPKLKDFRGWMNAFGKDRVRRGDIKTWRFRLLNNEDHEQYGYLGVINETWLDCNSTTNGFSVWSCFRPWSCKNNDTITIQLDMTGDTGKLSLKKNDEMDYKILSSSLEICNVYCICISMYESGEIQLL